MSAIATITGDFRTNDADFLSLEQMSIPYADFYKRPVAVITGASSGIGRQAAIRLAATHSLVLQGRNQERLAETVRLCGPQALVRTCTLDLVDLTKIEPAFTKLALQRVDVLINSAGIEAPGALGDLDAAQWQTALNLMVAAPALVTKALLEPLRAARGLVVMINSGAGQRGLPNQSLYCAAKFGLKGLTDSLRVEEAGRLRFTTIFPGRVDTPMQERIQAEVIQQPYRAEDHMRVDSVVDAILLAVQMPLDASVEELAIRPAGML